MYTRINPFIEKSKKICEKVYVRLSDFLLDWVIAKESIQKRRSGLEQKIQELETENSKAIGTINTMKSLSQEKEKKLKETEKELEEKIKEVKNLYQINRWNKHRLYESDNKMFKYVEEFNKKIPPKKEFKFKILLNKDNKIFSMNPRTKNLLGYLGDEAVGKKYNELFYKKEDKETFDELIKRMIELGCEGFNEEDIDLVKKDKKILSLKETIQFVVVDKLYIGSVVYLRKKGWRDHGRTKNEYIIAATAKDFHNLISHITKRIILKGADIEMEGPTKQKIKIPKKIENLKVTIDFKKADALDEKLLGCFSTIGSHLKNNFKIINAHHENVSTPLKTYEDGILEQYLKS